MNKADFFKGMGLGAAAGAAIGMIVVPKKKSPKCVAGKALKSAGDLVENITDAIGL